MVSIFKCVNSKTLKLILFVIGGIVMLLISFIFWIYFSLLSGPNPMEINEFHPFRSQKTKDNYYTHEQKLAQKWPVHSDEVSVHTSYGTTFMRISGPVDAPPLVLVPGGGCNSLIWSSNIKELSLHFRTYAIDNIYDYGRSVYTREIRNGFEMSEWLNELFDTLNLDNSVNICGYSFGAWVACQYTLYHPERLAHTLLLAPAATIEPIADTFILNMIFTLIPLRYFKSKMINWVWADLAKLGKTGDQLIEDRVNYYDVALRSFKFKQPVNPTVLTDTELRSLKTPTLFITGVNEKAYDAQKAISRIKKVKPSIQTILIPNTGHDLLFTHTDVVNESVVKFIGSNFIH